MNDITLVNPSLYLSGALAMVNEIGPDDGGFQGLAEKLLPTAFPKYIESLNDVSAGKNLREGLVPMSTYWLVREGSEPVGISRLRHQLTESLVKCGGHIGYWIRPHERVKGYGALILALTCEKASALGIGRVLVTCHKGNLGSIRVIERNGGVFDSSLSIGLDDSELRFWIDTKDATSARQNGTARKATRNERKQYGSYI